MKNISDLNLPEAHDLAQTKGLPFQTFAQNSRTYAGSRPVQALYVYHSKYANSVNKLIYWFGIFTVTYIPQITPAGDQDQLDGAL